MSAPVPQQFYQTGIVNRVPNGSRTVVYARNGGNDTTGNGKTTGTAYRTIQRAQLDVPLINALGGYCVIDCTGLNDTISADNYLPSIVGGRTWYDPYTASPDFPAFFFEGDLTYQAIPQVQVTLNAGTTTQSLDSSTQNLLITDTSQAWTAHQWQGLLCLPSDQSVIYTILDSGTDWILVSGVGDTITLPQIYDYGAKFVADDSADGFSVGQQFSGLLVMNGIKSTTSGGAVTGLLCTSPTCDIILNGTWIDQFEGFLLGTLRGFALTISSDVNLNSVGAASIFGGLLLNVTGVPASTNLTLTGGLYNSSLAAEFLAGEPDPNRVLFLTQLQITNSAIVVNQCNASLSDVKFLDCPGDCIFVGATGVLYLGEAVADAGGNVGYGLHVAQGGKVTYDHTNVPTVTGTAGDVRVGTLASRSWSDISTNAPLGLQYDVYGGGALLQADNTTAQMPPAGWVSHVADGAVVAGTFVKNSPTVAKVKQLATTDNPLLRIGIVLDSGTGVSVRVVKGSGQQVTMKLDSAGAAVIGAYAYCSQTVAGALSAVDNGAGVVGIFQTAGTAGTTADILS